MENKGILLYCIAKDMPDGINKVSGMDGNGRLYGIERSGLYAIVGDVDLSQYGEEAMAEKGEDIDWLKEKAIMFMDIILEVNSLTSIIPMKFLTIFTAEERVQNIIDENREQFLHNFEKISNREELSVKIYCDEKQYKERTMSDEIAAFEKSLAGKPKGASFFLKKKFEGELDDKIQGRIYKLANDFADDIKNLAVEMKSNKVLAKEITEIAVPMILNCAFLVDADKSELFSKKVAEMKGNYEKSGFMIELTGPWPPFSFCE